MKKKSSKKSAFNKHNECGTIDLVYRAKRRVGKILLFCFIVFVCSVFLCYRDGNSNELLLEESSKSLLVSQVQMKTYYDMLMEIQESEPVVEEEEDASEEVTELKSAKEESAENVLEYTEGIKKAYLTFDDGPSSNTNSILDVLDECQVKGNFFVIGQFSNSYKDEYQRIVNEGHVLGMHSYSHSYSDVYASEDAFNADINHLQYTIYEITGYTPTIYRFPGGSSNLVSKISMKNFINVLNERGLVYYDWNVNSGDADGSKLSKEQIIRNVLDRVDSLEEPEDIQEVMILFHDLSEKTTTVEALPEIIEGLQERGYVIAPIDNYTRLIQHQNIR